MKNKRGQAMLEYVLVFVALTALLLGLGVFVKASRHAAQTTALVLSSENA